MKWSLAVLVCVLCVGICGLGQTPSFWSGDFSGTLVLWFDKTSVTAELRGDLSLSGVLPIEGETTSFVTDGQITGAGEGDTMTLEGVAWVIFRCYGSLENGEEVEIRGGFIIDSGDFLLSADATGEGAGSVYLVALLTDTDTRIEVTANVGGSLSGSFVPADDPCTMQLAITGTMSLEEACLASSLRSDPIDVEALQERLPWDPDTWPDELSSQLLHLLVDSRPEE